MIITTSYDETDELVKRAINIANNQECAFVKRSRKTIEELVESHNQVIVVNNKQGLKYYDRNCKNGFYYHQNSAMLRYKRIIFDGSDRLKDIAELEEGMSFLDCTMGLAADSTIASYFVGEKGKVIGLEKNLIVAFIVENGLNNENNPLYEYTSRIEVKGIDFRLYLPYLENNSFDIVFFDFMFENKVNGSFGINSLQTIAFDDTLTDDDFNEAIRIANKKVVIKAHWQSKIFDNFPVKRIGKRHNNVHFGVYEVE